MIRAENLRCPDLDSVMALMIEGDDRVPLLGRVDRLPRHRRVARPLGAVARRPRDRSTTCRRSCAATRCASRPRRCSPAPPWAPNGLLNRLSVAAFNEFWYRVTPSLHGHVERSRRSSTRSTACKDWNRLYGSCGFLQYQYVVPDDAHDAVRHVDRDAQRGAGGVVPRGAEALRARQPGPLSFPAAGLDARARHPGHRARPGRAARPARPARRRRRRPHLPRQGLAPAPRAAAR